jgi:hypothetical protein
MTDKHVPLRYLLGMGFERRREQEVPKPAINAITRSSAASRTL